MTSDRKDIRDALLDAINDNAELRTEIEGVPDKVSHTVQGFVPIDTGTAKASIEVKARRTPYMRLSTRRIKVGEVVSDDDPQKIATLEYGRGETAEHGGTEAFAMFRRAAAMWNAGDG